MRMILNCIHDMKTRFALWIEHAADQNVTGWSRSDESGQTLGGRSWNDVIEHVSEWNDW